ncbi:hypothetical protein ACVGVM_29440 (plasmid) [Pseudonocardia bannensis]|uniref:hypothetical protein n=1 Tax=Pseudonocardia sp. H11422 TaxID=2835866 RepID=UPI002028883B|nr:hypothetical protein [Pseudonocardia sp. H11422]
MAGVLAGRVPVGQEVKARGTPVFHIDAWFTWTSAVAPEHLPLRAGTDIAFLREVINYIAHQRAADTATPSRSSTTSTRGYRAAGSAR